MPLVVRLKLLNIYKQQSVQLVRGSNLRFSTLTSIHLIIPQTIKERVMIIKYEVIFVS